MNHYLYWPEGLLIACSVMTIAWLWQWKHDHPAIVDVVWSYLTPALAVGWIFLEPETLWTRKLLVAVPIAIWGVRLGTYLQNRLKNDGSDGRYNAMSEAMGKWKTLGYFFFYQFQALGAFFLALSPYTALTGSPGEIRLIDLAALMLWIAAFFGESIADHQLARFRSDPSNKGKVCDTGLWKYSRHPNYFFEWLMWIVWLLMASGSSTWWVSGAAALAMFILVTKITGIPYVEDQSIRSRGDLYRDYQQRTSSFIPWFPKLKTEI